MILKTLCNLQPPHNALSNVGYQLVLCSLMDRGGSHYRTFMITPLGCKDVLLLICIECL